MISGEAQTRQITDVTHNLICAQFLEPSVCAWIVTENRIVLPCLMLFVLRMKKAVSGILWLLFYVFILQVRLYFKLNHCPPAETPTILP